MFKKYWFSFLISTITFILLLLIISLLSYINIIKGNTLNILLFIIPLISSITGSFYLGNKSNNKGYISGIKHGMIYTLFLIIINLIFYRKIKNIIYYGILILTSILGGMIGKAKKRKI